MAQRGHPKQSISSTTLGHIGYPAPRGSQAMPNGEAGYLQLMGSDFYTPWLTSAFDCSSCVLHSHLDSLLTTSLGEKEGVDFSR